MTANIDPDSITGKHRACPGWVWSDEADQAVPCACPCHHEETK